MIILKNRSEVKVTVTQNMVCDTWPSQDASTHQIWKSCLKEYRSYAPDLMPILETRSAVNVNDRKMERDHPTFEDAFTHQI